MGFPGCYLRFAYYLAVGRETTSQEMGSPWPPCHFHPPPVTKETVWGTWPGDALSLGLDDKTFNKLRPLGAFDVWIAESQPPTSGLGQSELQNQLAWFNVSCAGL